MRQLNNTSTTNNATFNNSNTTVFGEAGYSCSCPDGWMGNGTECSPVCDTPCVHGKCTSPGICECDKSTLLPNVTGWEGAACDMCVQGVHPCHANASCSSRNATLTCTCQPGFIGDGITCSAVCASGCVHGDCLAPGVCTCHLSADGTRPGWGGVDCSVCVQGAHSCHDNATCSSENGKLACECQPGYAGDGLTCRPVCNFPCGSHGRCSAPNTCECDLGWTGYRCSIDCGCNRHSDCPAGVGQCRACQHLTAGVNCSVCQEDSWGDPDSAAGCVRCDCNGHGRCDPGTGACSCDGDTTGARCQLCRDGLFGSSVNGGTCYHGCNNQNHRVLLTESQGAISSGEQVSCRSGQNTLCYTSAQACAFLIRPDMPNQTVTLLLEDFETECGYDFMHVYDGPSTGSPLLAALSGPHAPAALHATSGVMLVQWFTDQNVQFQGFHARYSVAPCPANCSSHGSCDSNVCTCDWGWTGPSCQEEACPGNCSASVGGGVCMGGKACSCKPGFLGVDCSFRTVGGEGWIEEQVSLHAPVAGHTAVVRQLTGDVWMYGGRLASSRVDAFSSELSVLAPGRPGTSRQVRNPRSAWPQARHGHSAATYGDAMIIYGGLVSNGVSDELWVLHFANVTWILLKPDQRAAVALPPPLFGHTATVVGDKMLVLGGRNLGSGGFVQQEYWFHLPSSTWAAPDNRTRGARPTALFRHSAVYSNSTGEVIVFGGLSRLRMTNGLFRLSSTSRDVLFSFHKV